MNTGKIYPLFDRGWGWNKNIILVGYEDGMKWILTSKICMR